MKSLIPFSAVSFLLLLATFLDCSAIFIGPIIKEELILESRDVIHGIITEVRSEWNEDHSMIYTYAKLKVLDVYKGEPRDEVVIQIPGGSVGDSGVDVEDAPELKEGMDVIIHTYPLENGNLTIYDGERGVYMVNNGVVEELNMTLDQFKNLVDEVIKK
jgi:hypothetical protein